MDQQLVQLHCPLSGGLWDLCLAWLSPRGEDDGGHSSPGVCTGRQCSLLCCTAVSDVPHHSAACTDKMVLCLTKCVMLQEGLCLLRACPHRALAGSRRPLGAPKSPHIVREGMQCHKVLQDPFVRGSTPSGHGVHWHAGAPGAPREAGQGGPTASPAALPPPVEGSGTCVWLDCRTRSRCLSGLTLAALHCCCDMVVTCTCLGLALAGPWLD